MGDLGKGKNKVDATREAKHAVTHQKPLDVVRLSSESTRENPRLLAVTKEAAQTRDGYSKGSLYELQREQQQRELHQKATGGWHPGDPSNSRPLERLRGGVITDSQKTAQEFLTSEECEAKRTYHIYTDNKAQMGVKLYNMAYNRITSRKRYSETDVIDELNRIRQSSDYINAFAESSQQGRETQQIRETRRSLADSDDTIFRNTLLQSLAQQYTQYTQRRLDFSHFEASVSHFNHVRKTNYKTEEMVQLLQEEGYLT